MTDTDKLAEALRAVISKAILEQAATWEEQFDAGPGDVVGVPDAVFVAADAVIAALKNDLVIAVAMAKALGLAKPEDTLRGAAAELDEMYVSGDAETADAWADWLDERAHRLAAERETTEP